MQKLIVYTIIVYLLLKYCSIGVEVATDWGTEVSGAWYLR